MGTSSSNTGGAAKKRVAAGEVGVATELPPRSHDANVSDPMVCEPPVSNPTAEEEGDAKERVDPAGLSQDNAAGLLPPTCNCSPNLVFNNVSGGVHGDFMSFAMSLQTTVPVEGGNYSIQAFRTCGVIDFIGFLEGKNAEITRETSQQMEELHTFYRSQVAQQTAKHQEHVTEIESRSLSEKQDLSTSQEGVAKELRDARAEVSSTKSSLSSAESALQDRNKLVQKMQKELDDMKVEKYALIKSREALQKEMNSQKVDLEIKLSHSQEAEKRKDRDVQRLNGLLQEKDKAIEEMQSARNLLTSECEKLKGQLAAIELKTSQESLTSGSYADDHANPGMLVAACHCVDTAMDSLVRVLHDNSISGKLSRKAPEVEWFIGRISCAKPGDFTRPLQVKHVWGHWICAKMFQGFEHVFFDMGGERTSPLDPKKHATECFRRFSEKNSITSSDFYKSCDLFREFCAKMYCSVFPLDPIVNGALVWDSAKVITCNTDGRLRGDGEVLYPLFLDVAKAIWLLHELTFSFDPPASILRMGWGEPFDKQLHESVVKDADSDGITAKVVLMLRPAFRVKGTVMPSRVFLSKKP